MSSSRPLRLLSPGEQQQNPEGRSSRRITRGEEELGGGGGGGGDFRCSRLSVEVHIVGGFLAETTAVARFERCKKTAAAAAAATGTEAASTGSAGDEEAELVFPLPEGAKVCALAVDFPPGSGHLVDASLVGREDARRAFEAEVRQKRAAAMVEMKSTEVQNEFRTRIFPAPSISSSGSSSGGGVGSRTVRLRWTENLSPQQSGAFLGKSAAPAAGCFYDFPLCSGGGDDEGGLDEFSFRVLVHAAQPAFDGGDGGAAVPPPRVLFHPQLTCQHSRSVELARDGLEAMCFRHISHGEYTAEAFRGPSWPLRTGLRLFLPFELGGAATIERHGLKMDPSLFVSPWPNVDDLGETEETVVALIDGRDRETSSDSSPVVQERKKFVLAIQDHSVGPAAEKAAASAALPIKHPLGELNISLVWDASHSRLSDSKSRDFGMLEAIFRALAKWPCVRFHPITFSMHSHVHPSILVEFGDGSKLLRWLRSAESSDTSGAPFVYDGATNLASIPFLESEILAERSDLILLFTDGISTLGDSHAAIPAQVLPAPIFSFCSATRNNMAVLRTLAVRSGGQAFNLRTTRRHEFGALAAQIGKPAFSFLGIEFEENEAMQCGDVRIDSTYPQNTVPISGHSFSGSASFSCAADAPPTVLRGQILYGVYGSVMHRTSFDVALAATSRDGHVPDSAIPRIVARSWAARNLDELKLRGLDSEASRADSLRVARQFQIVTEQTSLLVLCELDQFLLHGVLPPRSLPEVREHYLNVIRTRRRSEAEVAESRLMAVLAAWNKRVAWFRGEFHDSALVSSIANGQSLREFLWSPDILHHDVHVMTPPETKHSDPWMDPAAFRLEAEQRYREAKMVAQAVAAAAARAEEALEQAREEAARRAAELAEANRLRDEAELRARTKAERDERRRTAIAADIAQRRAELQERRRVDAEIRAAAAEQDRVAYEAYLEQRRLELAEIEERQRQAKQRRGVMRVRRECVVTNSTGLGCSLAMDRDILRTKRINATLGLDGVIVALVEGDFADRQVNLLRRSSPQADDMSVERAMLINLIRARYELWHATATKYTRTFLSHPDASDDVRTPMVSEREFRHLKDVTAPFSRYVVSRGDMLEVRERPEIQLSFTVQSTADNCSISIGSRSKVSDLIEKVASRVPGIPVDNLVLSVRGVVLHPSRELDEYGMEETGEVIQARCRRGESSFLFFRELVDALQTRLDSAARCLVQDKFAMATDDICASRYNDSIHLLAHDEPVMKLRQSVDAERVAREQMVSPWEVASQLSDDELEELVVETNDAGTVSVSNAADPLPTSLFSPPPTVLGGQVTRGRTTLGKKVRGKIARAEIKSSSAPRSVHEMEAGDLESLHSLPISSQLNFVRRSVGGDLSVPEKPWLLAMPSYPGFVQSFSDTKNLQQIKVLSELANCRQISKALNIYFDSRQRLSATEFAALLPEIGSLLLSVSGVSVAAKAGQLKSLLVGNWLPLAHELLDGARVLTSLAEMDDENPQTLRALASRLEAWGLHAAAVSVFERVLAIRGEEPQSYRDLALALANRAHLGNGPEKQRREDYERACELLDTVLRRDWDVRFHQIEIVAALDLHGVRQRMGVFALQAPQKVVLEPRFFQPQVMELDLRVVLTWDFDLLDVDLLVQEPTGEVCTAFNNSTGTGALMSRDFTGGYGPVEFLCRQSIRTAPYVLSARLRSPLSGLAQRVGGVTAKLTTYTNFGRVLEQQRTNAAFLTTPGETVEIMQVLW